MRKFLFGAALLALSHGMSGPATAAESAVPEFSGCQPGRLALLQSFFGELHNDFDRIRAERLMAVAREQQAANQHQMCIATLNELTGVLRYAMVMPF